MNHITAFARLQQSNPANLVAKKTAAKRGKLEVYGAIGGGFWSDGITAKRFNDELKKLGDVEHIDLHINSEGGQVTEARDMYNALVQHGAQIHVEIGGLAASAATFLAMAGDTISISEGALFMIHNASLITFGDAREHDKSAKLLRTVNDTIIDTYMARTKIPRQKLAKWMDDETWFSGKEAVDHGFATDLIPNKGEETVKDMNFAASRIEMHNLAACGDRRLAFNRVPPQLQPNQLKARAILARLRGSK